MDSSAVDRLRNALSGTGWVERAVSLARSLRAERVMVVASYRPDELHRRHPLRPLLGDAPRA